MRSEKFTLPVGFGGNMNYSNVVPGEYKQELQNGKTITIVISKVDKYSISGYLECPEGVEANILLFMRCIDHIGILKNKGVYTK